MVIMAKVKPKWILGGCPNCRIGDLYREDHAYVCLQCQRIFPDKVVILEKIKASAIK